MKKIDSIRDLLDVRREITRESNAQNCGKNLRWLFAGEDDGEVVRCDHPVFYEAGNHSGGGARYTERTEYYVKTVDGFRFLRKNPQNRRGVRVCTQAEWWGKK